MSSGAGAGVWVLGALPFIVVGYLFLITWYRMRYVSANAEGQRLLFMCAAAGMVLAAISIPASRWLELPWGENYLQWAFGQYAAYVETLALAAMIGYLSGQLLNLFDRAPSMLPKGVASDLSAGSLAHMSRHEAVRRDLADGDAGTAWARVYRHLSSRHGSPLQRLLIRAEREELLVAVTLTSRKVYCGLVLELSPTFRTEDQYIEIIPLFSAAREKDTLVLCERTEYQVFHWWRARRWRDALEELRGVLERLKAAGMNVDADREFVDQALPNAQKRVTDFEEAASEKGIDTDQYFSSMLIRDWAKVIPLKLIESASIYDETAHKLWFTQGDPAADSTSTPKPDQATTDPA